MKWTLLKGNLALGSLTHGLGALILTEPHWFYFLLVTAQFTLTVLYLSLHRLDTLCPLCPLCPRLPSIPERLTVFDPDRPNSVLVLEEGAVVEISEEGPDTNTNCTVWSGIFNKSLSHQVYGVILAIYCIFTQTNRKNILMTSELVIWQRVGGPVTL